MRNAMTGWLVAAGLLVPLGWAQGAPNNPATDWFSRAGWGVFVHYLNGLQNSAGSINSLGQETPWDQAVREFDTERFADTMQQVGANYVIFTVMQVTRHLIAPNATYDRITGYRPGEACATRDLIEDLYQSLHARGIPLMLYYTGDGPRADDQANAGFGFTTPVNREFVEKWASVAREYSLRYGDKIAGWWVDGCYPFIGYTDETLGIIGEALKAGNPNSIVAFNRGVDPVVMSYTPEEDFTCGEQNSFYDVPADRWLDGEQWHILSFVGNGWGQAGSKYTKQELSDYVADVSARGGVVSIDVLLFRDGSLDRSQVEMLKAVAEAKARYGGQPRPPFPPGNLAFRKQSKLLSLDGSHQLPVNGGTQFPRLGVDGRLDTYALAGGEWAWTYEVDLVDTVPVRRIKVTFAGGYPTEWQFKLSTDGQNWTTVAEGADHDGSPLNITFAPQQARYVRICSVKPNDHGQKGSQMSVAELEVYE